MEYSNFPYLSLRRYRIQKIPGGTCESIASCMSTKTNNEGVEGNSSAYISPPVNRRIEGFQGIYFLFLHDNKTKARATSTFGVCV